jgi:hypothetical protein
MQRSRSDFPASAGFGKSLNVEAPDFRLPPNMQNIAAFVQQIFSSPEAMHAAAASRPSAALTPASSADNGKTRAAGARAPQPVTSYETVFTTGGGDRIRDSESTTFSIGGAAEASAMSRQTPNVGRGGKGPGSIGSGGALSRSSPRASYGDDLEASVAQLELQSTQQQHKAANPVQQAIRQAIQSTQQPTKQQQKQQSLAPQQHQQQQRSLQTPPSQQPVVKQQKQKQSETRAAEDAAAAHAAAVVKGPSCVVDEVLSSELEVCRFGLACVCLARGHTGRAQGLRCKYGLHTKQEWKDAQAKVELAEAAVKAGNADHRKIVKSLAKAAGDAHRAIDSKAVSEGASSAGSSTLKRQQQDRQQPQQSKNGKDASVSAAGKKSRVGAEVAEQTAGPAAPALAKHAAESPKQQDRQRDETSYPDLQRRLASERGAPASEAPWLRDLTRPLSPFREADAMMKRNKELAVR